jgi:hypothetical protein
MIKYMPDRARHQAKSYKLIVKLNSLDKTQLTVGFAWLRIGMKVSKQPVRVEYPRTPLSPTEEQLPFHHYSTEHEYTTTIGMAHKRDSTRPSGH